MDFSEGIPRSIPIRFPHLSDIYEYLGKEITPHDNDERLPSISSIAGRQSINEMSQIIIRKMQHDNSYKCSHHTPPKRWCIREHISIELFPGSKEFHIIGAPNRNRTGDMPGMAYRVGMVR